MRRDAARVLRHGDTNNPRGGIDDCCATGDGCAAHGGAGGDIDAGGGRWCKRRTVYVDDNGTVSASAKGASGKPNFSRIQAAVDDVPATTIVVCKGTYSEQVAVTGSLSLVGRASARIQAPVDLVDSGAIVRFSAAQKSRLSGFMISGAGGLS